MLDRNIFIVYYYGMTSIMIAYLLTSHEFKLPPGLLKAICYVESKHNPTAINRTDSHGGSFGVCQVKIGTAKMLGFQGSHSGLLNATTNVYYAGKYLRYQINRYSSVRKGIIAYNSGHYDSNNVRYYNKVMKAYNERK